MKTYPVWSEAEKSVNLIGFAPAPLYNGGYYLFATPHTSGGRLGVVLTFREQKRIEYRRDHSTWREALLGCLSELRVDPYVDRTAVPGFGSGPLCCG